MDKHTLSIGCHYNLFEAKPEQLPVLLSWFESQHDIYYWGGPGLTYPIDLESFAKQIRFRELDSYGLVDCSGQLLGFGQFYRRLNRHHLGRLAVAPDQRGKGLSKPLIAGLVKQAERKLGSAEASLFVMADNIPALKSYQSLGFEQRPYPEPLSEGLQNCPYMVLPDVRPLINRYG